MIERNVDACNRFDMAGVLATPAPDVLFENVSAGQVIAATQGLGEFCQRAVQCAALFTKRRQTITAWAFRRASVVVTITWRWVCAVDVPEGPGAGNELALQGESEFEFEGERISRIVDRS